MKMVKVVGVGKREVELEEGGKVEVVGEGREK